MASLLTNNSAMIALQTLTQTSKDLATTQSHISTGLRVTSAADNAAYWTIATKMKSDNDANSSVTDALNLGAATVDVGMAALNSSKDLVSQIKAKLVTASQPGVDRTAVQADIAQLQKQLKSVADSAAVSGQNWVSVDSGATDYSATKKTIASFTKDSTGAVSIGTIDLDASKTALYDAAATGATGGILDKERTIGTDTTSIATMDISALTDSTADQATMANYIKMADTAFGEITAAASTMGSVKTRISIQQTFVSQLSDAITSGIGSLVDADMNKESTRLQALQVQQQLGVQSMSIANQNTQMILSLFR
ncbi:flagellin [Methylocella sp. CPCC 101449]|jgi:flagellin|uniref:flagellin N-terminal helical domain-containing protein n=1 Tax=Methylocella sp. CPCC 101449 TaxID=2987531 RepID=UPI00288C6FF9|nr:flagellin [Methylocella sp. CPCC 101449]MDT2021136.1 flagellin [Methylocella sp. CPCC 101449]HEV2572416.1 flagellin [Beijerinckiaceae bacterium]